MKVKFFAIAALAATTILASSCSKENSDGTEAGKTQLSVKISGVIKSRAVEAPGSTVVGTIQLDPASGHHIFVINPLGGVTHHEDLVIANVTGTGTGQILSQSVPADSRVYVVCNIPVADLATISALTTFDAIKAATSLMTTQSDYTIAALANSNGLPEAIVPGATTATVNVSINPLISRLELVQIQGGANAAGDEITAFTVTGVYVDSYYLSFTYGGGGITLFDQGASTAFTGIGDAPGPWAAANTPLAASPDLGLGDDELWAHNVASGGVPRFIIRMEGIKYLPNGGTEVDLGSTPHYVTVTGYTGVTAFERGKIYRIGGANGITFTPDDLGLTPNPVDVDLTVNVTIEEWVLVTPDAIL